MFEKERGDCDYRDVIKCIKATVSFTINNEKPGNIIFPSFSCFTFVVRNEMKAIRSSRSLFALCIFVVIKIIK